MIYQLKKCDTCNTSPIVLTTPVLQYFCRVPIIFRGRTSPDEIMTKLSKRKIKWASDHVVKHEKSTKSVAALSKVTQRRIQQLVKL